MNKYIKVFVIVFLNCFITSCTSEYKHCKLYYNVETTVLNPGCFKLGDLNYKIQLYESIGDLEKLQDAKDARVLSLYMCNEQYKKYKRCDKSSHIIPYIFYPEY